MMRLDMRLSAWLGDTRLAEDVPVVDWTISEKLGDMPGMKLTVVVPGDWYPTVTSDPLYPAGQWLRAEWSQDGAVRVEPRLRITETPEGAGTVDVSASSVDLAIAEDPWPYPTSPATGATLAQEVRRLAAPVRTRLAVPDAGLPSGLTWSGDRVEALQELATTHGAQWRRDADGVLVLEPLGNIAEPVATYPASEITTSKRRKLARDRVSRVWVVTQTSGDEDIPIVVERRRREPIYQPDTYGTISRVESVAAGTTRAVMDQTADTLLAEGGGEREFSILADIRRRPGDVIRLEPEHRDGRERVVGRIVSQTIKADGTHTVTIQEA